VNRKEKGEPRTKKRVRENTNPHRRRSYGRTHVWRVKGGGEKGFSCAKSYHSVGGEERKEDERKGREHGEKVGRRRRRLNGIRGAPWKMKRTEGPSVWWVMVGYWSPRDNIER